MPEGRAAASLREFIAELEQQGRLRDVGKPVDKDWEIACIAKARGEITLVGPYKRGKPETPCCEVPFDGPELERGFDGLLLSMLREASSR